MAVRTSPEGRTDHFDTQDHPALSVEGGWVRELHQSILAGAGHFPSTGFIALSVAVAVSRELTSTGKPTVIHVYGFGSCGACGK